MFGAMYAAEGSSARGIARCGAGVVRARGCGSRDRARVLAALRVVGREIVLDLSGLTRLFGDATDDRRGAAAHGRRSRPAGPRGDRRHAHRRAAARPPPRRAHGHRAWHRGRSARATAARAARRAHRERPNSQRPTPNDSRTIRTRQLDVVVKRWGLRTLGDLAALPADDVAARLGQDGVRWQRLARGEDAAPLVPAVPEERFEQALDLEWPIEELEPLSFVLGRLLEPLEAHLERRDRGAAVLHVRLFLVKTTARRARCTSGRCSCRRRCAMRARCARWRCSISNRIRPPAAIDRVVVAVDPTPARIVQFSLLTRPLPSPEQISTLMARLQALMGETRCGSPALVDSWQPGAFAMTAVRAADSNGIRTSRTRARVAESRSAIRDLTRARLRRFRHPVPARVRVEDGKPARVTIDRRGLERRGSRGVRRPVAHVGRLVAERRDGCDGVGSRRVGRDPDRWRDVSPVPRARHGAMVRRWGRRLMPSLSVDCRV